jgi:xylulokinase
MWYILGAILSAGLSLRWLRGVTGLEAIGGAAYAQFSAEAGTVTAGANGLIFLPYLTGERTPLMDAKARGGYIGLTAYHERGHLARAVMEGVAFALRQALEISVGLGGQVESVVATGGGMESAVWRQILADVLDLRLQKTLMSEQTGTGAALLAGVGVGVYGSFEEAGRVMQHYGAPTEPNPANRAVYDALYAEFTGLYPKLREDFHRLAGV